jgi:hypothetical protein
VFLIVIQVIVGAEGEPALDLNVALPDLVLQGRE